MDHAEYDGLNARAAVGVLIEPGTIARGRPNLDTTCTPMRRVCWRGFVYKPGSKAGADSLSELTTAREEDIPRVSARLKGSYFVAVHCEESGNTHAFVDPAGLYHAYYSQKRIGTSFLELCTLEHCSADDIDPEALVEFFHFGAIFGDRTFFQAIRRIGSETVLRSNRSGIVRLARPVADIGERPQGTFKSLLRELVVAARDERVSVDITGGADTRLLAVALAYLGMPFEMATSGRPALEDIEIGAKVAEVLGRPYYPTYHSARRVDWEELFFRSDGIFDVARNSRLIQLQHDRKSRGMTLSISGAAGEFFRETWWMHDFPLYVRRKARLSGMYSLHVAPSPLEHRLLHRQYRPISNGQREMFLRRFSRHVVPGATRTYDQLYYYFAVRTWAGGFVSSSADLVNVSVPYADRDVVRIGYHRPRLERMLGGFHRKITTKYSREAAKVPTTEAGASLEAGAWPVSIDLWRFVMDRSQRFLTKMSARAFGKTYLQANPDDPDVLSDLLRTLSMRKSTEALADYGVLSQAFAAHALPRRYAGRIFVLDRLFEHLSQTTEERSLEKTYG